MGSLGNFITETGRKIPLDSIIRGLRDGVVPEDIGGVVPSQGMKVVLTKRINYVRHDTEPGDVRKASREEVIFKEIELFATNRNMKIIGVILIMLECGYGFYDIKPTELHDWITQLGFEDVSLVGVRRMLNKVEETDLLEELLMKRKISLNKAYNLFRGK